MERRREPGLVTALALLVASTAVAALMMWHGGIDQPAPYHPLEESGRSPDWIKVESPDAPAAKPVN